MMVSVITPIFNSSEFISETISSVLNQSFSDWEMILVDDFSSDNSVEIVQRFIKQDRRIKLLRLSENSGAAVARNTAIEAASGKYIAFLDSDDRWFPNKLKTQITYMKSGNHALTYSYYEKIDEDGLSTGQIVRPPDYLSYNDMLKSCQIGCLTAIYDAHQLGKVYMPLIRKRQDWGLWLKILRNVPYAYCCKESLALYRVRKGSISSGKIRVQKYSWQLFREVEGLSFARSCYYLGHHIGRNVKNSLRNKISPSSKVDLK